MELKNQNIKLILKKVVVSLVDGPFKGFDGTISEIDTVKGKITRLWLVCLVMIRQ